MAPDVLVPFHFLSKQLNKYDFYDIFFAMDSQAVTILVTTAVASIIVAFFLLRLAMLTSHGRRVASDRKRRDSVKHIPGEGSLKKLIAEEINAVVGPEVQSPELVERLSAILKQEVNKRTKKDVQEVAKKYERIIEEKVRNEEIAWKKYNKVLSEKRQTESVIRSVAEGLVVVDAQGKVIMINPAAEKILGVSKKDKVSRPIVENLNKEQLVSLVKETPGVEGKEIELASSDDDTKRIIRASSAVIENEDGKTVGMVSVLSDITKQKELDRLKSEFLSSVSHELRTPLVSMEKSIGLLLSKSAGALSAEQEEFLSITERNLKRLTRLINDLLDLSKLEAAKVTLKRELVSLEGIIQEAVEGLSQWAKAKSLNIELNIQEGLPRVSLDPDRIVQVLVNLIGNAIKFTPAGGTITIDARLAEQNSAIIVSVQDSGIGIPQEQLTKVFDKFYQVGERIATDIHGTGIGLSIAKEIVELHDGRIWAESQQGSGAKFSFTLPLSR